VVEEAVDVRRRRVNPDRGAEKSWLVLPPAAPAGPVIEGHADPIDDLLNDRVSLDTP
jgi:hypothetical protein